MRTLDNRYDREMCQHECRMIDAYQKMSLEEGHHQKVICDLFLVSDLLEKSGYVCRIKERRVVKDVATTYLVI